MLTANLPIFHAFCVKTHQNRSVATVPTVKTTDEATEVFIWNDYVGVMKSPI